MEDLRDGVSIPEREAVETERNRESRIIDDISFACPGCRQSGQQDMLQKGRRSCIERGTTDCCCTDERGCSSLVEFSEGSCAVRRRRSPSEVDS